MSLIAVDVRTSGGEKLQAHVDGVQGGQFLAALVRNYREQYRRQILPIVAGRVPKVSGRLSKSFKVEHGRRRGSSFALTSTAPYVNDVRFREPRRVGAENVRGLADRVYRSRARDLARRAGALALRELG